MEEEDYYQEKQAKEYQTMIGENGLDVIHFGKTWKRPNREETAIDHALTNKPESIKNYQKIEIAFIHNSLHLSYLTHKIIDFETTKLAFPWISPWNLSYFPVFPYFC